jgi:lipopolysaccharide exporter
MIPLPPRLPRPAHVSLFRGSVWTVALRWSVRGTGLISTLILARLLTPADFGVVAMAMLVVGMLEVFSETGQKLALIRHPNPSSQHFDSAWTISVLIGLVLGVAIIAVAPLSELYFHEPRAIPVIYCLALRAVVGGFENIGVVEFRKELKFGRDFYYNLYQKVAALVVTVTLAFIIRNYWALVAGILTSRLIGVWLSYQLHPFRPRFSFAKVRELWSFSGWVLVKHVGNYLHGKIDEFAVGGMAGTAWMGRYNVAADLATAPTQEIAGPVVAALFPVMATVQGSVSQVRDLYLRVLYWSCVISTSTSIGVVLIADELVPLVLGPQWGDIVPLIIWLALAAGVTSMTGSTYVLFEVLGKPHVSARLQWTRVICLSLSMIPIGLFGTIEMAAMARLGVTLLMTPMLLIAVTRLLSVTLRDTLSTIWRPIVAAAAMAAVVLPFDGIPRSQLFLRLLIEVIAGAGAYSGSLLLLWMLLGRPDGLERDIVAWARAAWRDRRRAPASATEGGVAAPVGSPLNVYLYVAIPTHLQLLAMPRSLKLLLKQKIRQLLQLMSWFFLRRKRASYHVWLERMNSNKGDVAIRESIKQQISRRFAERPVIYHEIGWGHLDDRKIAEINASDGLFLIGGSGYFHLDRDGELADRVLNDLVLLPQIRCPKFAYSIGINRFIYESDAPSGNPIIATSARKLMREVLKQLDGISVRDRVTYDELATVGSAQPIFVTGDAALFFDGADAPIEFQTRPDRLHIGINLAFHGSRSAAMLERNFNEIVRFLKQLRKRHAISLHYFRHTRTERIIPWMLLSRGIFVYVRNLGPEQLIHRYKSLDVHICQMLHSSILSLNAGIPTMNIAYDQKNAAFFELMGLRRYCLQPGTVTADALLKVAEELIAERVRLRTAIQDRKHELRLELERFLRIIHERCSAVSTPSVSVASL